MFAGCGHVSSLLMRILALALLKSERSVPKQTGEFVGPDSASGFPNFNVFLTSSLISALTFDCDDVRRRSYLLRLNRRDGPAALSFRE